MEPWRKLLKTPEPRGPLVRIVGGKGRRGTGCRIHAAFVPCCIDENDGERDDDETWDEYQLREIELRLEGLPTRRQ